MLALARRLKLAHGLKTAVISNEGRELTTYRVKTYGLTDFIDFFIASSFVHIRKPDEDMYQMALDLSQIDPQEALYIEDRAMFVEIAARMGIRGLHHTSYENTRDGLASFGLLVQH
jgi:putative hydrolase of the HAD superfamily